MPNIRSAKKRVKVIDKKTLNNKIQKSELKTSLKKLKADVAETKSPETISQAYKAIDKAVSKGIIHKNAAAHKKSALAAAIKG